MYILSGFETYQWDSYRISYLCHSVAPYSVIRISVYSDYWIFRSFGYSAIRLFGYSFIRLFGYSGYSGYSVALNSCSSSNFRMKNSCIFRMAEWGSRAFPNGPRQSLSPRAGSQVDSPALKFPRRSLRPFGEAPFGHSESAIRDSAIQNKTKFPNGRIRMEPNDRIAE